MAEARRVEFIMPSTAPPRFEPRPLGPAEDSRRKRSSRVITSDGTELAAFQELIRKRRHIMPAESSTLPVVRAPPRPPVPRPEANNVDSAIRRGLERLQFAPLTEEWFKRVLGEIYKQEEVWGDWTVYMDCLKMLRSDYRFLRKQIPPMTEGPEYGHVPPSLVDMYLYLACEYRNRAISRTLPGGDLSGDRPTKQKLSCVVLDTRNLFWDYKKGNTGSGSQYKPQDFPGALARSLDALGQYDDETFQNLDYVLIPYEFEELHTVLLGIACKQRFAFLIDQSGLLDARPPRDSGEYPSVYCMHLLEAIILQKFGAKLDTATFPLFGQWHYRTDNQDERMRKTDNSPNASRQNNVYNCGMMTMTCGLNFVFGYDMLCYRSPDINDVPPRVGKRLRVAAEFLNGGFGKPFDYPLFKIPTGLREIVIDETYQHNIHEPRPPTPPRDFESESSGESAADSSGGEDSDRFKFKTAPTKPAPKNPLRKPAAQSASAKATQQGARTKVRRVKKIKFSGQSIWNPDPLDPDSTGPGTKADGTPHRTLWPAQMDPTRTGKCGFVYPIKNRRFTGPEYRTRMCCKKAAWENNMVGWELWEKLPLPLFKAWMENTMAGREDEELTPWIDAIHFNLPEKPEPTAAEAEFVHYV